MTSFIFAKSAQNLPILGHRFGIQGPRVLILGGVHGDEVEGIIAANALVEHFLRHGCAFQLQLTIVPVFNVDGMLKQSRTNHHGVDLNRNLPTKDWSAEIKTPRYHPGPFPLSEPENQSLVEYLQAERPQLIISLHSWHPMLNVNGDCQDEAAAIAALTGYRIDAEIGYPTPGCLGTYAARERQIPVITYEIQRGLPAAPILKVHVPAILEALKVTEKKGPQT